MDFGCPRAPSGSTVIGTSIGGAIRRNLRSLTTLSLGLNRLASCTCCATNTVHVQLVVEPQSHSITLQVILPHDDQRFVEVGTHDGPGIDADSWLTIQAIASGRRRRSVATCRVSKQGAATTPGERRSSWSAIRSRCTERRSRARAVLRARLDGAVRADARPEGWPVEGRRREDDQGRVSARVRNARHAAGHAAGHTGQVAINSLPWVAARTPTAPGI